VTRIIRSDYTIKDKQKKITMSSSQPSKTIKDKFFKKNKPKKGSKRKNNRFEKNENQI
jgi:hypothetical protein